MLKKYSEQRANNKKAFEMWKARGEVEVNGNGTSGYVVKQGPRTQFNQVKQQLVGKTIMQLVRLIWLTVKIRQR